MADLWTCPTCKAQFITPNQWHSCNKKDVETHFVNRPDAFVLIFDEFVQLLVRLGDFKVRSVPSAIIFKKRSSFASVKLQKSAMLIEWITDREIDNDERIEKILQISKRRFAHVIRITSPEEFDQSIQQYLTEAFQMAKG